MATTVKFGHANVKSNWRGIKTMSNQDCLAFGTSETNRLKSRVATLGSYESFFGGLDHPNRRRDDTAVFRQKRLIHTGAMGLLIAEPSSPAKMAGMPRFASMMSFQVPGIGIMALWEIHLHWIGPAVNDPDVDRVHKTSEGMDRLFHLLKGSEAAGIKNMVVGDFNTRQEADTPGWDDAWDILQALKFKTLAHGIDGVGISPKLEYVGGLDIITKKQLGSDHDGFTYRVRSR